MTFSDAVVGVEQFSCILSMIGSSLVALSWAYPLENRLKHGRILLFWLSVTDFFSSLIYFIQTFVNQSGDFCKVMALMGIFFPVASFLWTDFIAFYLYQAVMNRSNQMEWKKLLRIFHCLAWGISAILVIFVAAFDHAGGAQDAEDGIAYSNTGGWCWISGSSTSERFYWELIGGKIVEWCSCLVILPYLYASVSLRLRNIDSAQRTTSVFKPKVHNNVTNRLKADVNVDLDNSFTIDPRGASSETTNPLGGSQQSSTAETNVVVTEPYNAPSHSENRSSQSNTNNSYSRSYLESEERRTDSYLTDTNRSKYACESYDAEYAENGRYSSQITEGDMHLQSMGHASAGTSSAAASPDKMYRSSVDTFTETNNNNIGKNNYQSNARTPTVKYSAEVTGGAVGGAGKKATPNGRGTGGGGWIAMLKRVLSADNAEDGPADSSTGGPGAGGGSNNAGGSNTAAGGGAAAPGRTASGSGGFFTKFYVKLSALPLVFLFLRLWGSIRIILDVAHYRNHTAGKFFAVMQAFFDPSQGFFNAILFVFLSKEDRSNLLLSLAMLTNAIAEYIPCCGAISALLAKPLEVLKKSKGTGVTQRLNQVVANKGADKESLLSGEHSFGGQSGSFGGLNLSDDDSDFECDESNRISDFSFESRLDSVSNAYDH